MRARVAFLVAALLVALTAACAPPSVNSPADAVLGAVYAIAAHDLRSAARHVCPERRADHAMPFIVNGITGAVDGLSFQEGFALIDFDASRLTATEVTRAGNEARVILFGVLVETIDPDAYEAAFRARARVQGEPLDEALLRQSLGLIGHGRYELPVDQEVRLVRQADGVWRICERPPTP